MEGWVKLHRRILEDPTVCKDSDYFAVWCYLLLQATHADVERVFGKERITLRPGQLITGRKKMAEKFNISESKVQRILKRFEIEQLIEQQPSNKNRLISILHWEEDQHVEQPSEQPVNNKRTTSEQQVNTNKNLRTKELKNLLVLPTDNPALRVYGEMVELTDAQYQKLVELFGEDEALDRIRRRDVSKSISGNTIGSDFEKILQKAGICIDRPEVSYGYD